MGQIIGIPKWHISAKQWRERLPRRLTRQGEKQLIPPMSTIRTRMTKIMMMLPGVRNKTKVMMMTAVFPYCPNQERHLRQILKIMVYIGIISRSPCHTCIIFQTKFQIFAFFLVHFAWFSFLFFSSGFSLIVSFVFKPPLISKYFAYYLQLIGKKMLRKNWQHHCLLVTVYMFKCFYQYCLLMTFSHLPVLIL